MKPRKFYAQTKTMHVILFDSAHFLLSAICSHIRFVLFMPYYTNPKVFFCSNTFNLYLHDSAMQVSITAITALKTLNLAACIKANDCIGVRKDGTRIQSCDRELNNEKEADLFTKWQIVIFFKTLKIESVINITFLCPAVFVPTGGYDLKRKIRRHIDSNSINSSEESVLLWSTHYKLQILYNKKILRDATVLDIICE